jgi:hypothetical protein
MKYLLSLLCYAVGDLWSLTLLRLGIGYSVYSKLMQWSSDLDRNEKVWRHIK